MQSFIVLGIIPGTNIELNFSFWVMVWLGLVCTPAVRALWRRRGLLHEGIVALQIGWFTIRHQVSA
jgi:hypothetical protein